MPVISAGIEPAPCCEYPANTFGQSFDQYEMNFTRRIVGTGTHEWAERDDGSDFLIDMHGCGRIMYQARCISGVSRIDLRLWDPFGTEVLDVLWGSGGDGAVFGFWLFGYSTIWAIQPRVVGMVQIGAFGFGGGKVTMLAVQTEGSVGEV